MNALKLFGRNILVVIIALLLAQCSFSSAEHDEDYSTRNEYVCTPCGQICDNISQRSAGDCRECNMPLVEKSTLTFKSVKPSGLCEFINSNPDVVILDVRTKEEFEGRGSPNFGRIRNAINLPVQELESRLETLNAYKDRQIIVYCSHSRRSPRASYILTRNGFNNVTNIAGGMSEMADDSCKVLD